MRPFMMLVELPPPCSSHSVRSAALMRPFMMLVEPQGNGGRCRGITSSANATFMMLVERAAGSIGAGN